MFDLNYTKLIKMYNYEYFCNLKIYLHKMIRIFICLIYIRYSYSVNVAKTNIFIFIFSPKNDICHALQR